jgi:hypothetical protein
MIPNNISQEDLLRAIREINKSGIPEGRMQKRYVIEFENKYYPPKYTISVANKYANGYELESGKFGGGAEANSFLNRRGFKIIRVDKIIPSQVVDGSKKKDEYPSRHHARCPICKEHIFRLLSRLYSIVEKDYQLKLGADIKDYSNSSHYDALKRIYFTLQAFRRYKDFVRTSSLPPCDFFVPNPGFIVEFDERQHFSRAREISFGLYPSTLELWFDRKKWTELCRKIGAKDNDPKYRDEQRAWYDALRDFAPAILGLMPTVRLFDEDRAWCEINPDNQKHMTEFKETIQQKRRFQVIEIKKDVDPFFARVIIVGPWKGEVSDAKTVLEKICDAWPENSAVKFLLTCGGFIQFDWPKTFMRQEISDNLDPNEQALREVFRVASQYVERVLDGGLRKRLSQYVDYLTLGVDSSKDRISMTKTFIGSLHCELVFLIGLKTGEIYFTGKSYPTNSQQRGLVRIADLQTHFLELVGIGKTMILGCHDLSIYSPRSMNAKGWRRNLNREFRDLASKESPHVVLHHPHTADAVMTWLPMWSCLQRNLPSVQLFAGAGRYYNKEKAPRSNLNKVLRAGLRGNSIDFIVGQ